MAARHLEIILDREGPFREGDRVAGRAMFTTDAPVTLQGGSVSLSWRTRGHGNVETGTPDVERDGPARVEPGVEHSIPFAFVIPAGPVSILGELVSVEWVLAATVEVPWAIDPTAERIIEVAPRERMRLAGDGYRSPPRRPSGDQRAVAGHGLRNKALIALAVGLVLLVMGSGQLAGGAPWFFVVPTVGLMMFLVVRQALPWVRNATARSKIGAPVVQLAAAVPRGERLPITVSATPRAGVHVEEVTATLTCTESARKGSGKNASTKTHLAHADRVVLATAADLAAGATATWSGIVTVPLGAPPSFASPSCSITWTVVVRIAVKGWPDDEEAYELTVEA